MHRENKNTDRVGFGPQNTRLSQVCVTSPYSYRDTNHSGFDRGWSRGRSEPWGLRHPHLQKAAPLTRCPHRFHRELFRRCFRTVFPDTQLHWFRFCSVTEQKSIFMTSHDVIGQASQFHYVLVFLTSQPFAFGTFFTSHWKLLLISFQFIMPHAKANSVPYLEPEDFDEDLFIDEIKKFPEVWDKANDGYHMTEKREQAW